MSQSFRAACAASFVAVFLFAGADAAAQNKNLKFAKKCSTSMDIVEGKTVSTTFHALYWSAKQVDSIEQNEKARTFYNGFIKDMLRMEIVLPIAMTIGGGDGKDAGTQLAAGTYQATFVHKGEAGWRFMVFAADGKTVAAEVPLALDKGSTSKAPMSATWVASEKPGDTAAFLNLEYGPLKASLKFTAPAAKAESRPAR